jgi:PKHD-type hydroxylase
MNSWPLRTANEQRAINFNTHAVLGGVFTAAECRTIIELGTKRFPVVDADLAGSTAGVKPPSNSETIRKGHVSWINPEDAEVAWIYQRCTAAVLQVNNFDWQFDLDYITPLQFTCYDQIGDHYNWHTDTGLNIDVSYRKLSFSIQLSHPHAYEGGELELSIGPEATQMPREQGIFVAFPSMITHRVRPITRGERYSLVGWVSGPRFR